MAGFDELVRQMANGLFGLVVVGALLAFILKRNALDWEKLVSEYGREWVTPPVQRRFQNFILYSAGRPAKPYQSSLTIGLFAEGVGLRPSPAMAPFHAPIYVPYTDIKGWKQTWYLNARSIELEFSKTPEMRLIMPAEQVEWIEAGAGGAVLSISEARPAHKHWPWLTYMTAIAFGLMAVSLIALIFFQFMR